MQYMSSKTPIPKKSLGQHWLNDDASLDAMVTAAEVQPDDTVLEIGPGPGALTRKLVKAVHSGQVVAVEFDHFLALTLPSKVSAKNLTVVESDILRFDFTTLPAGYRLAANIPYYLTSNLLRVLSESSNPPQSAAILMQKEVAERVAAPAGAMSLLSITVQFYWHVDLAEVVKAELFTPPPKVDSQILCLQWRSKPLFDDVDPKAFFRLVKAGFGERRKTLRNSLSGGLGIGKDEAEQLLGKAGIDPGLRAQSLTLEQWHNLYIVHYEVTVASDLANKS
jgi:16S rRNA (adenine1518-N6/adenine1519-N6)-dimethyltransferase